MARADGFAVMDVSTSILDDPKFRALHRQDPAHLPGAFMAYIAVMAESWKAGRRATVVDAWPTYLRFNEETVEAMQRARLIDKNGLLPAKTWSGWFKPAFERRETTRERWRRANDKRGQPSTNDSAGAARTPTGAPRGNDAVTGAIPSVRSVRPSGQSVPSVPLRATAGATANGVGAPRQPMPDDERQITTLQERYRDPATSTEIRAAIKTQLELLGVQVR